MGFWVIKFSWLQRLGWRAAGKTCRTYWASWLLLQHSPWSTQRIWLSPFCSGPWTLRGFQMTWVLGLDFFITNGTLPRWKRITKKQRNCRLPGLHGISSKELQIAVVPWNSFALLTWLLSRWSRIANYQAVLCGAVSLDAGMMVVSVPKWNGWNGWWWQNEDQLHELDQPTAWSWLRKKDLMPRPQKSKVKHLCNLEVCSLHPGEKCM